MPGRNDPCPCGSGKKYKKCCLKLDQGQARAIRQLNSPAEWVGFHWQQIENKLAPAIEGQLGLIKERWGTSLGDVHYQGYLKEHALLDVGQNSAQFEEVLRDIGNQDQSTIESFSNGLTKTHLSCYEVSRCRRDQFVEFKDHLSGECFVVMDAELSNQLEPLEAICGRLVQYDEQWQLLPNWTKLKFRKRKQVFRDVRSQFVEMGANIEDREELNILLKRSPEVVLKAIAANDAQLSISEDL